MAGTFITSEPNKVYVEDVQYSASVSEAVGSKLGSSMNYILDNFDYYEFGVSGAPYSSLTTPYTFNANKEAIKTNCVITDILVFNAVSGTSGTTEFRIERQLAAGGSWDNIFSVNGQISNTASDDVFFKASGAAPSGVTLPVVTIDDLFTNDKLRFVLVSAASGAENLKVLVIVQPVTI